MVYVTMDNDDDDNCDHDRLLGEYVLSWRWDTERAPQVLKSVVHIFLI